MIGEENQVHTSLRDFDNGFVKNGVFCFHRIHGWYIYLHEWPILMVGKHTMHAMGFIFET